MSKISDILWTEKYRPKTLDDLICSEKEKIKGYLKNPKSLPSFIFYSSSPGTGKTSTAKIISRALGGNEDLLQINASDERGIDVIRDKIRLFAQSMSSDPNVKRCIFLDEADGLTKQAQESMKALMEMYSSNCFFILSCNDIAKIIEPIRKGRCLTIDFSRPSQDEILKRLQTIVSTEKLKVSGEDLCNLMKKEYPDIRSMVLALQTGNLADFNSYSGFMKAIKEKNVRYVYDEVYSNNFDMLGFTRYYMEKLFDASEKIPLEKLARVAWLLADIEKSWAIQANLQTVFVANILEIMRGS